MIHSKILSLRDYFEGCIYLLPMFHPYGISMEDFACVLMLPMFHPYGIIYCFFIGYRYFIPTGFIREVMLVYDVTDISSLWDYLLFTDVISRQDLAYFQYIYF